MPAVDVQTRVAIEDLVHRHAWLIDHGRAQEVAALFTQDARLLGIGPDKIGRPAIAAWADARQAMGERRSRHVQSNIVLDHAGADIHGTVVLTLYRHDGPGEGPAAPCLIGEYGDVYRRNGDGMWRFAERRLTTLFGKA